MKADLVDTEWRMAQALQTLQDADDDGYLDPGMLCLAAARVAQGEIHTQVLRCPALNLGKSCTGPARL